MNSFRHRHSSLRILYFGTQSSFSLKPLLALIEANQHITGVVLPVLPPNHSLHSNQIILNTNTNDTIIDYARKHALPMWNPSTLPSTVEFDVIVVACFPNRLPDHLLGRAQLASVNIHPSMLPRYRGPSPLFWQLRDGLRVVGVTLHHMNSSIDSGDIVSQMEIELPLGISGSKADQLLSKSGADLLLDALKNHTFSRKPQIGKGSYQSWPNSKDWHIPTTWPVVRAFNFIKGVENWGIPFTLLTKKEPVKIWSALGFRHKTSIVGYMRTNKHGQKEVGFSDGWLQF